ncbi:MAG: YraN family protein [Saprospiraceae bacterium]|nr:YraN family protein [Saprospiraceae bacterium]MCB0623577.1 YraN family protein [Saprospiraceae bacterium]MCB0676833.1 YraN family protein [Saprospiraceae bacterium]MCB0680551.1 YraN family protein [Saprospiraceae bacterium]
MAKHLRTGEWGEQLAARFLEDKGLRILERNWRFSRAEIDLIAEEGEVLVFVEVKTRTSDYFGPPERFVSARKRQLLADAAAVYCEKRDHSGEVRFDVVAILLKAGRAPELRHLPDAFFPGLP